MDPWRDLIRLLASLEETLTVTDRRQLVRDADLLDRIGPDLEWQGSPKSFVQELLTKLHSLGKAAFVGFVQSVRDSYSWGVADLQLLDRVIAQLNAVQDAQWQGLRAHGLESAEVAALMRADIARESFEPITVPIPARPFLMGSAPGADIPDHETPQHEVHLPDYRIGTYPVMNWEYELFLRATQRLARPEMRWDGQAPFKGEERHPVNGITWCDALAYCQWLSAETGRRYTLPSEAHWEKAARGADGRTYPWGEWEPGRCNQGTGEVAAVDAYVAQSVYGCFDLAGNVPEWTSSLWGKDPREPDERYRYPWQLGERDDLGANSQVRRIVRGGAAVDPPDKLRCAARTSFLPLQPGPFGKRHGFRVMLELQPGRQAVPFCDVEGRQP